MAGDPTPPSFEAEESWCWTAIWLEGFRLQMVTCAHSGPIRVRQVKSCSRVVRQKQPSFPARDLDNFCNRIQVSRGALACRWDSQFRFPHALWVVNVNLTSS